MNLVKTEPPKIKAGTIFYSDNESYLSGLEDGINFATESPVKSRGIFSSNRDDFKFMLIIEEPEEDSVEERFC